MDDDFGGLVVQIPHARRHVLRESAQLCAPSTTCLGPADDLFVFQRVLFEEAEQRSALRKLRHCMRDFNVRITNVAIIRSIAH